MKVDEQTLEFLQFNDAAAENLGDTREEFAKLTVHDIEAVYPPAQLCQLIAERFCEGELIVLETKHRTKSGAVRDVIVYYRVMTIDGHWVSNCVWEDVTEKKVAEAALLQSEKLASMQRGTYLRASIFCVTFDSGDAPCPCSRRLILPLAATLSAACPTATVAPFPGPGMAKPSAPPPA